MWLRGPSSCEGAEGRRRGHRSPVTAALPSRGRLRAQTRTSFCCRAFPSLPQPSPLEATRNTRQRRGRVVTRGRLKAIGRGEGRRNSPKQRVPMNSYVPHTLVPSYDPASSSPPAPSHPITRPAPLPRWNDGDSVFCRVRWIETRINVYFSGLNKKKRAGKGSMDQPEAGTGSGSWRVGSASAQR